MYQNLINSLKKILDSKSTQAEKLLKISTLVDFAEGLEAPQPARHTPNQPFPVQDPYHVEPPAQPIPKPTSNLVDAKKPNGVGPLIGIEDVK